MIRFRRRVAVALAALAVAGGAAVATELPAGAAVSQQSPSVAVVQIGSPALISGHGANINVPITFVCSPGSEADVDLSVVQRSGGGIAWGENDISLGTCTGGLQSATVSLLAHDEAFHSGVAVASAFLFVGDFDGFITGSDQRNITIAKK